MQESRGGSVDVAVLLLGASPALAGEVALHAAYGLGHLHRSTPILVVVVEAPGPASPADPTIVLDTLRRLDHWRVAVALQSSEVHSKKLTKQFRRKPAANLIGLLFEDSVWFANKFLASLQSPHEGGVRIANNCLRNLVKKVFAIQCCKILCKILCNTSKHFLRNDFTV